jgi:hypothetical protein
MLIALRLCCFAWNCRRPRWNDDCSFRMTAGGSIVGCLTIIRAIRGQRRNVSVSVDLTK